MEMSNILLLFGGLGFFLYGMKLMSEALEKVAGSKMRKVLEMCTKNRFVGIIVGFLFTAVIQSSSAATVLIVSFVNSGLISIAQSVGPILGANIGTTVTGLLVAMNMEKIAPVFIIIGVIMVSFSKKHTVQKIGEVILGFGVLFYGMAVMKDSMSSMENSQVVKDALSSTVNPFLAVLAGFVITTILQSSSASTSILIGMASSGLVGVYVSMFIILGCNIGTCTSAMLASISSKKDAKRTAWIHMWFNICSMIVSLVVLIPLGEPISQMFMNVARGNIGGAVAISNVVLKLANVIILLPFMNIIVKMACRMVPGEDKKVNRYELKYINENATMATVVVDVTNEIRRMGIIAKDNLELSAKALINPTQEAIDKVFEVEDQIDFLSGAITEYLVSVAQTNMPINDARDIAAYFHVVNDFERIGDHAENLAEFAQTRMKDNINFSEKGLEGIKEISDKVLNTIMYAIEIFADKNEKHLEEIQRLENEIDDLEEKLQRKHVKRLATNECSPKSAVYSDILSNLERVSDHATNIAFAIHKADEE